ncbi:hypothetical protein SUGI_0855990 [Cryptomeria japonica]|nr:hypothetical protein SUGI_0855990 [Cryptomeria japonica]
MNHFVLAVYRNIFATIVFAPFAFFLERNLRTKITFPIFCQFFVLGLLGPVSNNFYYVGLEFSSPTFGSAMFNLVPVTTFFIALIFRMEKIQIRKIRSQSKIVGTLVCVSGAMVMTFYNGPIVPMPWHYHHLKTHDHGNEDIFKGCLCLVAMILSWASLFVLQAWVLKSYPAQLSLTTLVCLIGSLQSLVVTWAIERHPSVWALGFDMKLLTAVYSGVIVTGVGCYLQGLCMKTKGPVFATAFFPLGMVITAIMDSIILHQRIYLGSVLGAVVIVIGFYGVLWGKMKDTEQTREDANVDDPLVSGVYGLVRTTLSLSTLDGDVEPSVPRLWGSYMLCSLVMQTGGFSASVDVVAQSWIFMFSPGWWAPLNMLYVCCAFPTRVVERPFFGFRCDVGLFHLASQGFVVSNVSLPSTIFGLFVSSSFYFVSTSNLARNPI